MTYRMCAIVFGALLVTGLGCASSSGSGTPQAEPQAVRRSTTVLTSQELTESGESNLFQAIQKLRPHWLRGRSRGTMSASGQAGDVVVYLETARFGNATSLQQISVTGVYDVQYLDASEATNRFGTGHTGGAIVIRTQKP